MGGPTRTQQPAAQPAQAAPNQDAIDAFVHPSVQQINALAVTHPQAPLAELADILRHHPADYEASMRAIHRLWGNQVAVQLAIAVPHITLAPPGHPAVQPPGDAPTRQGEPDESPMDATQDPTTGEVEVSASAGPVTAAVTGQPHNDLTGQPGRITGGSVEVAGDVGPNTHAGVTAGVASDDGQMTASMEAAVRHRVSDRVAVGGTASVETTPATGEVRASGGASVHLQLSDATALRIAGGVDSTGQLNQEVALDILRDPARRVPLSDDGHRRLSVVLRATETPGNDAAPPAGGVTLGIGGTF